MAHHPYHHDYPDFSGPCVCGRLPTGSSPDHWVDDVSPCTLYVKQPNGLNWMRDHWHRPSHGMIMSTSLLLASPGTPTNLPPGTRYRHRDVIRAASFLHGTANDIRTMSTFLQSTYDYKQHKPFARLAEPNLTVERAKDTITRYFNQPDAHNMTYFILYYCGHGEETNGDWVFHNGVISLSDIRSLWLSSGRDENQLLIIISDSCYSGKWIEQTRQAHLSAVSTKQALCSIGIIASADATESCAESSSGGGDFTTNYFSINHVTAEDMIHVLKDIAPHHSPFSPHGSRCREALFTADHSDVVWGHDWWYQCVDHKDVLSAERKARKYQRMILTKLDMDYTPEIITAMERGYCHQLISLKLSSPQFHGFVHDDCEVLANALKTGCCSSLEELDLSRNNIGDSGASALASILQHSTSLTTLDLSKNLISDAGAKAMAEALKHNTSLLQLDLSVNRINSGLNDLATALQDNLVIQQINLSQPPFNSDDFDRIHQLVQRNRKFKSLAQRQQQMTLLNTFNEIKAAELLVTILQATITIQPLDLSNNDTRADAAATATMLQENSRIKSLKLSRRQIGVIGIILIADALTDNNSLQQEDLSSENIKDGVKALALLLQREIKTRRWMALRTDDRIQVNINKFLSSPRHQVEKIALVIGNFVFSSSPPERHIDDANKIAKHFKDVLKFNDVQLLNDLNKVEIESAVNAFVQKSSNALAVFYFGGRVIKNRGINYLCPQPGGWKTTMDITKKAVSLTWVYDKIMNSDPYVVMMLIEGI